MQARTVHMSDASHVQPLKSTGQDIHRSAAPQPMRRLGQRATRERHPKQSSRSELVETYSDADPSATPDGCAWGLLCAPCVLQAPFGPASPAPDPAAAGHFPVRQPAHRSVSATPASAASMCMPQPAQVACNKCRKTIINAISENFSAAGPKRYTKSTAARHLAAKTYYRTFPHVPHETA